MTSTRVRNGFTVPDASALDGVIGKTYHSGSLFAPIVICDCGTNCHNPCLAG
jgi:hypothetical protein